MILIGWIGLAHLGKLRYDGVFIIGDNVGAKGIRFQIPLLCRFGEPRCKFKLADISRQTCPFDHRRVVVDLEPAPHFRCVKRSHLLFLQDLVFVKKTRADPLPGEPNDRRNSFDQESFQYSTWYGDSIDMLSGSASGAPRYFMQSGLMRDLVMVPIPVSSSR